MSDSSSNGGGRGSGNNDTAELRIFATVGTTRFDRLVALLVSADFLSRLSKISLHRGGSRPTIKLTIQYGNSDIATILASSTLASTDAGSQLIPEPGLRVIEGRRVYQNRLDNVSALDPGQTGTLSGLRIRHTVRNRDQVAQLKGDELGVADALEQALRRDGKTAPTNDLFAGTLEATTAEGIELEMFQFAPDLGQYIAEADLVISHAGSGTIIETLRKSGKPPALIVLANTSLMDNHQAELADALGREGYLVVGQEDRLADQIQAALLDREQGTIPPFPAFQPQRFQDLVDDLMGF